VEEDDGVVAVAQSSLSGRLRPVRRDAPDAVLFTEAGPPLPGVSVRIVDESDRLVPTGRIGRLQVTGDTMMTGYFNNAAATADSYTADGWFKTGDLGFVHDGSVSIAGREKDLIIVNGANYLSHEIEAVVEAVPGVAATYAAACGLFDPDRGTDRVLVFCVPEPADAVRQAQVLRAVRGAVAERVGLEVDTVVPVDRTGFPRTTSGKIQRGRLLADYRAGAFDGHLQAIEIAEETPSTLPSWFAVPGWQQRDAGREVPADRDGACLLLADDPVETLAGALRALLPGRPVVLVRPGSGKSTVDGSTNWLGSAAADGYRQVLAAARAAHGQVTAVVHAWGLAPTGAADSGDLEAGLTSGVFSVVRLIQALAAENMLGVDVLVATGSALRVRDGDRVDVATAAMAGLVRSAADERSVRTIRQVDLSVGDPARQARQIVAEIGRIDRDPVVAYRDGQRFVPVLAPVALPERIDAGAGLVRGGRYLLTGGLGGIGGELARYLLRGFGAQVLLVGRADAAAPGSATGAIVEALAALGEVRYVRCDVADTAALQAVVTAAEEAWDGRLDGVLHLAGASLRDQWDELEAHTVVREPVERFDRMFRAKIRGTWALGQLLRDRPETALVLFSSVNGFFGGAGFGAYAAANSFLDGFADYWAGEHPGSVQALAWSRWTGVGMNVGSPTAAAAAARGFRPIAPAQGVASFVAARALGHHRLLIGLDPASPQVLRVLSRPTEPVACVAVTGSADPAHVAEAARAATPGRLPIRVVRVPHLPRDRTGGLDLAALDRWLRPEPLAAPFRPPATRAELELASIWCQVLGRSQVGLDDSFFELGGSSLHAIQLQEQVSRQLGRTLRLRLLHENPTLRGLTDVIERA
jgi:NADP-dependent 3-hydroxy acid dehydrogenase YdfG